MGQGHRACACACACACAWAWASSPSTSTCPRASPMTLLLLLLLLLPLPLPLLLGDAVGGRQTGDGGGREGHALSVLRRGAADGVWGGVLHSALAHHVKDSER